MGVKFDVSKLAWKTDDAGLRALFETYGVVTSAQVAKDWEMGRSRRFGHVTMEDPHAAQAALSALQGAELDGAVISVEIAPGQAWPPAPAASAPPAASAAPTPAVEPPVDAEQADADQDVQRPRGAQRTGVQTTPHSVGGVGGTWGDQDKNTFG